MNCKNIILSTLIFFIFQFTLLAQFDQFKFTRIDVNQGLSHNQVLCIMKDSKGFVWFGTASGLNRYDGYNFKVFRHEPGDSTSLRSNIVSKLFEDHEGKIWVGTRDGFSIYDHHTEFFNNNPSSVLKKYSIPVSAIIDIIKDKRGNYWYISSNKGLFKYVPSEKSLTHFFHNPKDSATICSNEVSNLAEDSPGNLWLIHTNGALEKMESGTHKVIYRNYSLNKEVKGEKLIWNFTIDSDNDMWICIPYSPRGIFYFNNRTKLLTHIDKSSEKIKLNTDIVRNVVQDSKGLIWISTDHGGINLIDKKTLTVHYILHNEDDERSLSQNSINALYKDRDGVIWIGTYKKGINYYHENLFKFHLIKHQPSHSNSLSYDDVNRFVEDDKGNLWIGANGGGLLYFDRKKGTFRQILSNPSNPNGLSSDVIVSLYIDHEKKLWIGTYYGGLNCYDGKKFIQYKYNPAQPSGIGDDNIWEIFEDSQDNLWIGTLGGGLDLFDRKKNAFYHYRYGDINSIHSNYISSIIEDRQGNLWIGTAYGIDILDKQSGRFIHYIHEKNNPQSLSNNSIINILEDSRGLIWVATLEGLNLLDKDRKVIRIFKKEDGLPDNTVLTLLEDRNKNIWISTPNGISNLEVKKGAKGFYSFTFKNYDEADGLQGKEFNENAAYKTRMGELIFGGANGFNIFRPEEIGVNKIVPRIVLSDFQVFNRSLKVGEAVNGHVILNQGISDTKEITLDYKDNVFSIEFAALSYLHPEKNKYSYILEGFNKEWMTTDGKIRKATYTNLNPGEYIFRVKASNNDGFWNNEGINLKITVLPPFWKTRTAFILYILFIIGALILLRYLILKRAKINFQLQQERQEANRIHELDLMKIKFLTNVSHEFRTPLTLIITPLDKILKNVKEPDLKDQLSMIYRNARRLLNLVNQLLDFKKIEEQGIKLNPSEGDIVKFIREVSYSFSNLSEKKKILFSLNSSLEVLETFFDQDKLEKILFNLLSNAFKFTPENGSVTVEVNLKNRISPSAEKQLEIKVKDTGIGIHPDNHEKIFERFFQDDIPGEIINQGSGIGLSIVKEFVRLHDGIITLESEPGKGTTFTVLLPVKEITQAQQPLAAATLEQLKEAAFEEDLLEEERDPIPGKKEKGKPLILLIEDNDDFRHYIRDNLKGSFQIIEATNGKEGWSQVLSHIPDLIVSDVMMPEMDGIELCKKIKRDPRSSHIPVILLTARSAEEQKLEGFNTGASDYITKPFNFEILLSRIKNLIVQQEAMRKTFQKQIEIKGSDINVTSLDEKLIQKAIFYVEANISNPDFSVEELSRELGMSRVHLYKKLLSLTGKSPIEFIRTIRLKRAAQLLEKSQLTVAEIAYQVGFNNPKYFTKYFKMEFNILPSLYAEDKQKEN